MSADTTSTAAETTFDVLAFENHTRSEDEQRLFALYVELGDPACRAEAGGQCEDQPRDRAFRIRFGHTLEVDHA